MPMKYPLILSLLVPMLWSDDLSTILARAKNNARIESARLEVEKSHLLLEEAKTAYFPTLTATALYQKKDRATAFEPKTLQGGQLGAEVTLFDGFRREALLSALHASGEGARQSLAQEEQNVLLETMLAYYDCLDTQARLGAILRKKEELDAQVTRFEILVKNDLATSDTLKSLVAERLAADYEEMNLKTLFEKYRKTLELLTAAPVGEPGGYRELATPVLGPMDRHDLHSDQASLRILEHTEDRYTYLPSVTVSGKHKRIDYADYNTMNGVNIQPETQNEITAAVSLTLFDMGRIAKEREQARIDTLKARKMLDYKTRKLQNDADISILGIRTAHSALRAAEAEEAARAEAFRFVKTRFEAGLINLTVYLSELSALTDARAKASHAKNALQVAKANAAYAHGIDLMSLLEEKP